MASSSVPQQRCTLGNAVHRDLCFPSRQRLRHCSRPFIHRQWARASSSRQAPAEQYTLITVLSSGRKHLDRAWPPGDTDACVGGGGGGAINVTISRIQRLSSFGQSVNVAPS